MASNLIVPPTLQPVSTQKGTGTYTCPTGKWAIVSITASVASIASVTATGTVNTTNVLSNSALSSGQDSTSFQIYVDEGDTVASLASLAAATNSYSGASSGTARTSGTTTLTIQHGGTAIGIIRAVGSAAHTINQTSGITTVEVNGSSSFHWFAQEYNIIT